MTSITLPRRIQNIDFMRKHSNTADDVQSKFRIAGSYSSDNRGHFFRQITTNENRKTARTLSCNEEKMKLSSNRFDVNNNNNNSRLKHLCTRFKRRFSFSKEYRTDIEGKTRPLSTRFLNYKSFSSSTEDSSSEFEWPDFEKIYDSIPTCLTRDLHGLDDSPTDDEQYDDSDAEITSNSIINDTAEQLNLFKNCERGEHFRRNAICRKLDKSQYSSQLDTFSQQLMVEKLIRTWA
ncbi:unnamed protein product [Rotaria socialis]|uniref:Uncharacterized protein n=1 Tax=Rotaria socialis TaxID=392032 RepID=A0A821HFN6_9BILA|nr:unnamed protein product [Rotaria socialis]CAF3492388.1 unnamed protein product [Rotaria socialis]CAF3602657.1 unnamed protein product [Rotaria socialis]CAF3754026.1 unnamed protein product [Rotaria socialis]CAF4331442.1 unnamed protein product [Rotaria socialis]